MHRRVRAPELGQPLAAAAAGRAQHLAAADHGDLGDRPLAGGHHHRRSRSPRRTGPADRRRSRRCSRRRPARRAADRGADGEARIGRVGALARRRRGGDQLGRAHGSPRSGHHCRVEHLLDRERADPSAALPRRRSASGSAPRGAAPSGSPTSGESRLDLRCRLRLGLSARISSISLRSSIDRLLPTTARVDGGRVLKLQQMQDDLLDPARDLAPLAAAQRSPPPPRDARQSSGRLLPLSAARRSSAACASVQRTKSRSYSLAGDVLMAAA